MVSQLRTFRSFPDRETAESFAAILNSKGIETHVKEDALVFDPSYAFNPLNKEYLLQVEASDYQRAAQALEEHVRAHLDEVDADYYLLSFNDEELVAIVHHPDEWGPFDYALAVVLLQQRGINYSEQEQQELKHQRIRTLAQPEAEKSVNILLGYCAIIIPIVGIALGWIWGYSTKTLPDGHTIHVYNNRVQRHGRIIFGISLTLIILTVLNAVLRNFPWEG